MAAYASGVLATTIGGSRRLRFSSSRSDACARASSRRRMVTSSSHDSGDSNTLRRYQVYCSLPMPEGPVFFGASVRSHAAKPSVAARAVSAAFARVSSLAGTRIASVRNAAL
jgi:hypothetical protein